MKYYQFFPCDFIFLSHNLINITWHFEILTEKETTKKGKLIEHVRGEGDKGKVDLCLKYSCVFVLPCTSANKKKSSNLKSSFVCQHSKS